MRFTKKMGSSCTGKPFVVLADETNPWAMQEALRKLAAYEDAEERGRLVVLPCAIDSMVYTIKEHYFDCKNCEHKAHARYRDYIQKAACDMDGWHCPLSVEEHTVQGFEISLSETGCAEVSAPGEWGYEGLETFSGVDGKWYCTRDEAEKALKMFVGSANNA